MAVEHKVTRYHVTPMELPDGSLEGLSIQRVERRIRESDNGRLLDRGLETDVGDSIDIPLSKVGDVMSDMNSWLTYWASGDAAREREEMRSDR